MTSNPRGLGFGAKGHYGDKVPPPYARTRRGTIHSREHTTQPPLAAMKYQIGTQESTLLQYAYHRHSPSIFPNLLPLCNFLFWPPHKRRLLLRGCGILVSIPSCLTLLHAGIMYFYSLVVEVPRESMEILQESCFCSLEGVIHTLHTNLDWRTLKTTFDLDDFLSKAIRGFGWEVYYC